MTHVVTWHGDQTDLWRLVEAIQHNCTCPAECPAHAMLTDQRVMNHLLDVYTRRTVWVAGEHYV